MEGYTHAVMFANESYGRYISFDTVYIYRIEMRGKWSLFELNISLTKNYGVQNWPHKQSKGRTWLNRLQMS